MQPPNEQLTFPGMIDERLERLTRLGGECPECGRADGDHAPYPECRLGVK